MVGDTDPDGMNPLQRLVVERMRQRGWTPKDVEDRGITHATLHRYTHPLELRTLPREGTMQQLAAALDLDYAKVYAAAVEAVARSHAAVSPPPRKEGEETPHPVEALRAEIQALRAEVAAMRASRR